MNNDEEEDEENMNTNENNEQAHSYSSESTAKYGHNTISIQQQRSNTTMHVCWHRNISVSANDNHLSVSNQLSGYLLRKFKNSNGWQKLWVVFTNFCLFFYKTYQVCEKLGFNGLKLLNEIFLFFRTNIP